MARRDPADFAEFVAARSPALHRAAYLMVGERGLAQDLLQEALTKTYVAWPRLREDQLQALAWKFLIPIGLANILLTGALKVAF